MIRSIFVKMPFVIREYNDELGVEVVNKFFVRVRGNYHIPLFNLFLFYPEVFRKGGYQVVERVVSILMRQYDEYVRMRKQVRFKVDVIIPEGHNDDKLYYLLQKVMIDEATPSEVKLVGEFLSGDIFSGGVLDREKLFHQYIQSIWRIRDYVEKVLIKTPVGITPLYVTYTFMKPYAHLLTTHMADFVSVAFVNVLTSHFFLQHIQLGSVNFNLVGSGGELKFKWDNVRVVSLDDLFDLKDKIIENNLSKTHPKTVPVGLKEMYYRSGAFLSHSPILTASGNAIDFKNKSVMFLFALVRRKQKNSVLSQYNGSVYLNDKKVDLLVVSVPFKNISKFVYRSGVHSGVFFIKVGGRELPVLSTDVDDFWFGVGRQNVVMSSFEYDKWYGLLRKLATPEHLEKAEELTQVWLNKNK